MSCGPRGVTDLGLVSSWIRYGAVPENDCSDCFCSFGYNKTQYNKIFFSKIMTQDGYHASKEQKWFKPFLYLLA